MVRFILLVIFLCGCSEPKTYECQGWEKRPCICPNGEAGIQSCSRGIAFSETPPPRKWLPCSCCFLKEEDDFGAYYIDQNDASGCWDDIYDPSVAEFLKDIGKNAK